MISEEEHLTIDRYAQLKRLSKNFLIEEVGLWESGNGIRIPYKNEHGDVVAVRTRKAMEGRRKFYWREEDDPRGILYGLWRLDEYDKDRILLVEGESDCHTLWLYGYQALGIPGVSTWDKSNIDRIKDFDEILFILKKGNSAFRLAYQIAYYLKLRTGKDLKVIRLKYTVPGIGESSTVNDICDLHRRSEGRMDFKENLERSIEQVSSGFTVPCEQEAQEIKLDYQELTERLKSQRALNAFTRKRLISEFIKDGLTRVGNFYHSRNQDCYYFNQEEHRLYEVGDFPFETLVNTQYGLNQTEPDYDFLVAELKAYAFRGGEETEVHQLSYYDSKNNKMYIHDGDQAVWVLDGADIEKYHNGVDGILFEEKLEAEPFEPDLSHNHQKIIDQLLIEPINFAEDTLSPVEQRKLYKLWLYSILFETIMPTKPINLMIGRKGAGKTTSQRMIGWFLEGENFNVSTVSKLDAFDVAISHNRYICFDNVDTSISWLEDRLSRAATGQVIRKRELYTTNKQAVFYPKCFLSLNARTPKFRREDVADRLLLFTTERLGKDEFLPENKICAQVLAARNQLWGQLLHDINKIIQQKKKTPEKPIEVGFRMADFADLAKVIDEALNLGGPTVERLLEKMKRKQTEYVLEENVLYLVLQAWVEDGLWKRQRSLAPRKLPAKKLYKELKEIAEEESYPSFEQEIKNPISLAKRLTNQKDELEREFVINIRKSRNKNVYSIKPR